MGFTTASSFYSDERFRPHPLEIAGRLGRQEEFGDFLALRPHQLELLRAVAP